MGSWRSQYIYGCAATHRLGASCHIVYCYSSIYTVVELRPEADASAGSRYYSTGSNTILIKLVDNARVRASQINIDTGAAGAVVTTA